MKNFLSLSVARSRYARARGFSLIEVLIALLVISFGLLGIAGMQAVSISNTGVAGFRSIAALQGANMAARMSANEAYWQANPTGWQTDLGGAAGLTVSVVGSTVTSNDSLLTGTTQCTFTGAGANGCTVQQMAQFDLAQWGTNLAASLPGGIGSITCVAGAIGTVTLTASSCTITIKWLEKSLAQNQKTTGVAATANNQLDYTLEVQP
jgi:type IV pilus assembly protein PilV